MPLAFQKVLFLDVSPGPTPRYALVCVDIGGLSTSIVETLLWREWDQTARDQGWGVQVSPSRLPRISWAVDNIFLAESVPMLPGHAAQDEWSALSKWHGGGVERPRQMLMDRDGRAQPRHPRG